MSLTLGYGAGELRLTGTQETAGSAAARDRLTITISAAVSSITIR